MRRGQVRHFSILVARQDKLLIVLHVEDDENDAVLLAQACQKAKLPVALYHVRDVEQAQAYLTGVGHYEDRAQYPLPQVLVVDLKLPRVDGFEFLKWIRGQPMFQKIPVLVFTASISREDKARALAEGASSYFVKPASFDALVQMVQTLNAGHPHQRN